MSNPTVSSVGLAVKGKDRCHFHQLDAETAFVMNLASTQRRCDMAQYGVGVTSICKPPGLDETFDDTSAGMFANLNLPPLEDADSINFVLNAVIRALARQLIPPRNAALILYALQIASGNLKRTHQPYPLTDKVSTAPTRAPKDYQATPTPQDLGL